MKGVFGAREALMIVPGPAEKQLTAPVARADLLVCFQRPGDAKTTPEVGGTAYFVFVPMAGPLVGLAAPVARGRLLEVISRYTGAAPTVLTWRRTGCYIALAAPEAGFGWFQATGRTLPADVAAELLLKMEVEAQIMPGGTVFLPWSPLLAALLTAIERTTPEAEMTPPRIWDDVYFNLPVQPLGKILPTADDDRASYIPISIAKKPPTLGVCNPRRTASFKIASRVETRVPAYRGNPAMPREQVIYEPSATGADLEREQAAAELLGTPEATRLTKGIHESSVVVTFSLGCICRAFLYALQTGSDEGKCAASCITHPTLPFCKNGVHTHHKLRTSRENALLGTRGQKLVRAWADELKGDTFSRIALVSLPPVDREGVSLKRVNAASLAQVRNFTQNFQATLLLAPPLTQDFRTTPLQHCRCGISDTPQRFVGGRCLSCATAVRAPPVVLGADTWIPVGGNGYRPAAFVSYYRESATAEALVADCVQLVLYLARVRDDPDILNDFTQSMGWNRQRTRSARTGGPGTASRRRGDGPSASPGETGRKHGTGSS